MDWWRQLMADEDEDVAPVKEDRSQAVASPPEQTQAMAWHA